MQAHGVVLRLAIKVFEKVISLVIDEIYALMSRVNDLTKKLTGKDFVGHLRFWFQWRQDQANAECKYAHASPCHNIDFPSVVIALFQKSMYI